VTWFPATGVVHLLESVPFSLITKKIADELNADRRALKGSAHCGVAGFLDFLNLNMKRTSSHLVVRSFD
jgi:hypothetical protein